MAEEGSPAARLEDPIAHTNAHARFWAKFAGGLIGGIVVGALAGAAVVAVIGTGGAAAPLLAAAAVGGARLVGGFAGSMAGDFIADKLVPEKLTVTGKISTASMDVFINSKARGAARASPDVPIDQVLCSKHSPPIYLAEGSETVYVNSWVMSRKDDHTTCGAKISEGSPDVFVGGPTARVRDVADEVPLISKIIVTAINVAFIVRGLSCLPKLAGQGRTAIPCLVEGAVGVGVGLWGLVSSFGNPIHAATGGKILGGEAELDFELPGPIALTWQRFYSSHDVRPDGLHGQGWSVPYNVALHLGINPADEAVAVLYDRQGRDIEFPRPEPGTGIYSQSEGYWLWCSDGGRYIVQTIDGQYWVFEPAVEGAPAQRLKLQRIEDGNANYIELRYQEQRLHQLTDSTGRLLQLRCDSLGRLVEIGIVTPAPGELPGVLARYRYDGAGQLAEVIDREGRTKRRFAYNADRHMTWHANAAGLECHYEWQGSGQWARVVRHWTNDGQRYDIRYEQQEVAQTPDPNRVQGRTIVTDQMGRVQTWLWNAEYRILSYTNPLGQSWSATYDDNKQRLSLTAPNGSVTRYRYGELGLLEAETDPLGRTWSTGWLSMGLPWRETAPDGGTQLYAWDERGNLTRHTAPDGSVTRYSRDKRGLPLRIIDAKGGTKRLRWSERAQLLQYTDCSEQSTHYEWDGWGNLKSVTDALGQKTEYTHDVRGRLRAASLPDGAHYQYGYNDAGQLASISDPLSRATRLNWNRRGQLTSRQDAQQRHIALAYDQAQRLSQLVNENNATFDFSYDAANRLTEEKRPGGQRVSLEHDANGWPIAVTQHPGIGDDIQAWQANETQPPEHRIWGNEAGSSQSLRTELIRDAARRLTEKRTAQYHSRYQYDAANRLLKASRFKVLGQKEQEGKPVEFELQLLHTVSYCYDKLGNCIKEITTDEQSGQSHTLKHSHDELGNRTQTVLPALPGQEDIERALNYLHYGSGHLHQIEFSKRDTQKPDEPAQRQTISDIERDNLHRETLRTQGAATTRYAWDPVGRRIGAWSQGSNVPTQPFGPKDSGAPVWQKAVLAVGTPEHNPLDGLMKAYAYDKTGELRHSLHSLHGNAAYQYDTTGRINQRVSEDFSGGIGTEVFGYDPAGNIQDSATRLAAERATAGSQRGYVKDNLVRVFEDKRFYYDGHGRLIKKLTARHTVQLFEWDDESHLAKVTTIRRPGTEHQTTQTATFDYDAIGRRIARHDSFGTTVFIWEGMRLIEERWGSSVISYVYEPGSYVPLARIDAEGDRTEQGGLGTAQDAKPEEQQNQSEAANDDTMEGRYWASLRAKGLQKAEALGLELEQPKPPPKPPKLANIYYFHNDVNGCPEELSNEQGQIVWQATYKTWGSTVTEEWEVRELDGGRSLFGEGDKPQGEYRQQNLRFQGQYLDRDTGLHYNTFRYYDPDIGRFISPDPIGLEGGLNLHSYSPNPIAWIDPWGLEYCNFGNKTEPRAPRPKVGERGDIHVDENGMVKSQSGEVFPQGKSTTVSPEDAGLTGHYHTIPENTPMPEGLGIVRDGSDVIPGSTLPPGHATIFPTRDMPMTEFESKVQSLPWQYGGKI